MKSRLLFFIFCIFTASLLYATLELLRAKEIIQNNYFFYIPDIYALILAVVMFIAVCIICYFNRGRMKLSSLAIMIIITFILIPTVYLAPQLDEWRRQKMYEIMIGDALILKTTQ